MNDHSNPTPAAHEPDELGAGPMLERWQAALSEREAQARELIRAHPVAALLGAAAIGFALARLLRERE